MVEPVPLSVGRVFDVVIVGAGLCGLALARTLLARGLSVQVIEARERLGGRVLTQRCAATGHPLDLGPAWFWSGTEPRITALLSELGLTSQPQHDPGDALWLTDPNSEPERRSEPAGVFAGARRIDGGAARLTDALAATLPKGCVRLGVALPALRDRHALQTVCAEALGAFAVKVQVLRGSAPERYRPHLTRLLHPGSGGGLARVCAGTQCPDAGMTLQIA